MPELPNPSHDSHEEPDDSPQGDVDPVHEFFTPFAPNAWKFHIPHVWDQERVTWEDVYLVPADDTFKGTSIWLTVESIDNPKEFYLAQWGCSLEQASSAQADLQSTGGPLQYAEEDYQYNQVILASMGTDNFLLHEDTCTLYVRASNFSHEELLNWVSLYLKLKGAEFPSLEEAPAELFSGSNAHAAAVENAIDNAKDLGAD